jgi:hypothetical protein
MTLLTYLRKQPVPNEYDGFIFERTRPWFIALDDNFNSEIVVEAEDLQRAPDGTLLAVVSPSQTLPVCPAGRWWAYTDRKVQLMGMVSPNGHKAAKLVPSQLRNQSRLVYDLMAFIRRYVVMTREQLLVTALWVIHTHCIEHIEQTPYLAVTSPEKRCGKSRLLETLEMLCARSWAAIMPSEAVVYRKVDIDVPTLLLDEVDAIFNPKNADRYEGLRALLNNGHRRGAMVPRCIGTSTDIAEFSTFCPKVLAGIGTLPDTVADRAIPIRLERKTKQEPTAPFKRRQVLPDAEALRKRVEKWAKQHGAKLAATEPDMPGELNDRMQEGCEALVLIADLQRCGADARAALVTLFEGERLDDQESMRIRLLRDIDDAFNGTARMSTSALLGKLLAIEDAPWLHYYGRGLDPRDLSTLLGHYGIKPTTVRLKGGKIAKGYKREAFHDAWERYL